MSGYGKNRASVKTPWKTWMQKRLFHWKQRLGVLRIPVSPFKGFRTIPPRPLTPPINPKHFDFYFPDGTPMFNAYRHENELTKNIVQSYRTPGCVLFREAGSKRIAYDLDGETKYVRQIASDGHFFDQDGNWRSICTGKIRLEYDPVFDGPEAEHNRTFVDFNKKLRYAELYMQPRFQLVPPEATDVFRPRAI